MEDGWNKNYRRRIVGFLWVGGGMVWNDIPVSFIGVAFISGPLSWHGWQIGDRICGGNTRGNWHRRSLTSFSLESVVRPINCYTIATINNRIGRRPVVPYDFDACQVNNVPSWLVWQSTGEKEYCLFAVELKFVSLFEISKTKGNNNNNCLSF